MWRGLLKKGIYKFNFELGFPPQGLPSSIDVSSPYRKKHLY